MTPSQGECALIASFYNQAVVSAILALGVPIVDTSSGAMAATDSAVPTVFSSRQAAALAATVASDFKTSICPCSWPLPPGWLG